MSDNLKKYRRKYFTPLSLFVVLYFIACYLLAIYWYNLGFFNKMNLFFDADPSRNLSAFAHGYSRVTIAHPFLDFISIPVRFIALIFYKTGLVHNSSLFSEKLALLINPLFSSISIIVFYRILKLLKLEKNDILILTLIFTFAFSRIVFSIVVESYAISGSLITILFYYFFKCKELGQSGNRWWWYTLGFLITGLTITNIMIFGVVFLLHLIITEKRSFFKAFREVSIFAALNLAVIVSLFKIHIYLIGSSIEKSTDWIDKYLANSVHEVIRNIINFLSSLVNTIVGFFINVIPFDDGSSHVTNLHSLSFYRSENNFVWIVFVFGLIIFIGYRIFLKWGNAEWRVPLTISLFVILVNFLLHSIFGYEMFLYSQHWIVPVSIVLVAVLEKRKLISIPLLLVILFIDIRFLIMAAHLIGG